MSINTTKRRLFLKGTVATSALSVAAIAGLITPQQLLAAWPAEAFQAKSVDDAMKASFGTSATTESGEITLKAPDIAENGAVVPVSVSTTLSNVESISIVSAQNGTPLTSTYILGAGTAASISTRIKMGKTSDVIAVVKSGGKLFTAKKEVKVTIGGCGG